MGWAFLFLDFTGIARGKIFGLKGPTRGKISIYSSPHELFFNLTPMFKINMHVFPMSQ